jgi:hypothetical protein
LNPLGLKASLDDPAGGRALLQRSVELATQAGDDWCRIDASNCLAVSVPVSSSTASAAEQAGGAGQRDLEFGDPQGA